MKKILISILMIYSFGQSESWLERKNIEDRNKYEQEKKLKEYEQKMKDYEKENQRILEDRKKVKEAEENERKRIEKLRDLNGKENEELATPYMFDGKIVYLQRGIYNDFLRINSNRTEFYIVLKEGEAKTYAYYIQNKSKVNGGCHNLGANGYYNCWFNFEY